MSDEQPWPSEMEQTPFVARAQRFRQEPSFDLRAWCFTQLKELVAAIRFLSTLPIPGSARLFQTDGSEPQLVIGSAYFPLVGLLIGVLLSVFAFYAGPYLPSLVLAALIVVAQILLSGGLHLDGLMDSCDGLFSRREPEQQLAIMSDSRVGSFGVLGACCVLLLKFSALASLNVSQLALVLLLVPQLARWSMVLVMPIYPSARPRGLGAAVRLTVTRPRFLWAAFSSLLLALLFGHWLGLGLWLGATALALAIGLWVTSRLGGLTGDIYGAIAEVSEAVLLLLVVLLRFWL